jgi:DNA-binding XRE family transcriptional regulator
MPLPFDQAAVDQRFLEEVYRLHAAGAFATFTELAQVLHVHRGFLSELEAGRYHCNLKLLYLLHAAYQVDVLYVLTGQSAQPRPPALPRPVVRAGRPAQGKTA